MTCPVPAFAVQVGIATGTKLVSDDDQIAAAKPVKVLIEPVPDPRWFVLSKTGQLQTFDPDTADSVDN